MRRITDKRIGTSLYGEGFFGNRLRQWHTPEALRAASPPPLAVVLRRRNELGGGVKEFNHTIESAIARAKELGLPDLYFGEQVENQPFNMALQGEYGYVDGIEHLFCSAVKDYMTPALEKGGTSFTGASCRPILRHYLDLASYENMMELADIFPGHIIEFTTATEPIGCLRRNTIIWEVRLY